MQEYLFRQQNLDLMDKKEITELGGEGGGGGYGSSWTRWQGR